MQSVDWQRWALEESTVVMRSMNDRQLIGEEAGVAEQMEFRHLDAFEAVYSELSYSYAAHHLRTSRRAVVRMVRLLEQVLGAKLFEAGGSCELQPTAFGKWLHAEVQPLAEARRALSLRIGSIHASGRSLRIASSRSVLRTSAFRTVLQQIRAGSDARVSHLALDMAGAVRAMAAGECEMFVTAGAVRGRFLGKVAVASRYRIYWKRDARAGAAKRMSPERGFVVPLDGEFPGVPEELARFCEWEVVSEEQWLHWLARPARCPDRSVVFAPGGAVDRLRWEVRELESAHELPLHVHFPRQHPYGFLAALASGLGQAVRHELS
jgi:hypothetical protein